MPDAESNRITLNRDSEKSKPVTALHEGVHGTEGTKGHERMVQASKQWLKSLSEQEQQKINTILKESYGEEIQTDAKAADNELTTKFVSEVAFMNPVDLFDFAYEKTNAATILLSSLNTAIRKIGQDQAGKAILDARNNLTKALYEVKRGGKAGVERSLNPTLALQYDKGKSFDGVDGAKIDGKVDNGAVNNELIENPENQRYNQHKRNRILKYLDVRGLIVLRLIDPDVANEGWRLKGYRRPPCDPNYEVKDVEAGDKEYVRVFGRDEYGTINKFGRWIMLKSDIEGLTPEQIRDKFALPDTPTHMCEINLSPDFVLQASIVNKVKGWGEGGGLQFGAFDKKIPEEAFGKPRAINK